MDHHFAAQASAWPRGVRVTRRPGAKSCKWRENVARKCGPKRWPENVARKRGPKRWPENCAGSFKSVARKRGPKISSFVLLHKVFGPRFRATLLKFSAQFWGHVFGPHFRATFSGHIFGQCMHPFFFCHDRPEVVPRTDPSSSCCAALCAFARAMFSSLCS